MMCTNVSSRHVGSFLNAEATVEVLQFGNNKTGMHLSTQVELVHVGFDSKKLINQNITEAAKRNGLTDVVCVWPGGGGGDQVYSKMYALFRNLLDSHP